MRYIISCFIILASVYLSGCLTIYFETPQPPGAKILSAFPADIQGSYLLDNDTLFIKEKEYVYPEVYDGEYPVSQLDSMDNIHLENNLLYDNTVAYREGIPYTIENDTLKYYLKIFISKPLSDSLLLTRMNNYLVLNEREKNSNYWTVILIEHLNNNNLRVLITGNFKAEEDTVSDTQYDGDLKDFFPITPFKKIDDLTYLINPSLKELETLIKQGFFVPLTEVEKIEDH